SLKYKIEAAKKRLQKAEKDMLRFEKMLKKRLIATSDYENVKLQRDSLADEIESMKRELNALLAAKMSAQEGLKVAKVTERLVMELEKGILSAEEKLKAQREALKEIEYKISYTTMFAPFDGVIAKKYFDAPRVIESGTPVYALTDPQKLYCEVLLSEKKMHGVKAGNRAKITVEALKDREFEGTVESIAPTSASTFSLVPRDIASGEFTKLDQRFVVRLSIKDKIDGLRAGMSATVAIERE
ncbi:MAG: HlyD family efflux transporter periplasmic adaptor subunit, partial [Hydrogenimonas sp.]|nr:HlyD family efflux transporter periplasmic adaptor subunit [Hydrogenimonas sp.]